MSQLTAEINELTVRASVLSVEGLYHSLHVRRRDLSLGKKTCPPYCLPDLCSSEFIFQCKKKTQKVSLKTV